MKRVYFMLAIVLAIISSCIKTIIVESTSNEKMLLSKSIEEEDCYVYLTVKNNAPNVTLTIDSCFVYNYDFNVATPCILETGEETIFDAFAMKPYGNGKLVFLVYGKVDTDTMRLYDGLMYVPAKKVVASTDTFIELEFYDGCPWYYEYKGHYIKVLQSIRFDVSVEGWENVEIEVGN